MRGRRAEARTFSSPFGRRLRLDADLIVAAQLCIRVVARTLAAFVLPFSDDMVADIRELRRDGRRAIRDAHVVRPEARVDRPYPFSERRFLESSGKGAAELARDQ